MPSREADLPPGRCGDSTHTGCGGAVLVDGASIELEPGIKLDLGGIGKGYAADRAAEALAVAGPCLVNAGGDIAVRGGAWPIGVTAELTLELTARRDRDLRDAIADAGGAEARSSIT